MNYAELIGKMAADAFNGELLDAMVAAYQKEGARDQSFFDEDMLAEAEKRLAAALTAEQKKRLAEIAALCREKTQGIMPGSFAYV